MTAPDVVADDVRLHRVALVGHPPSDGVLREPAVAQAILDARPLVLNSKSPQRDTEGALRASLAWGEFGDLVSDHVGHCT
jgi:hypothetical protein